MRGFSLIIIIVLTLFGCEDNDPKYELSTFFGEWELSESSLASTPCSDPDNISILTINDSTLKIPLPLLGSTCHFSTYSYDYSFDGESFTAQLRGNPDVDRVYKVVSASGNRFTWEHLEIGTEETYVKLR